MSLKSKNKKTQKPRSDAIDKSSNKGSSKLFTILFRVITLIAVIVLAYCGYKYFSQWWDYHNSNVTYEKIKNDGVVDNDGSSLGDETEEIDKTDLIGIDWDSIKHKDLVAWIQMDSISYPVYHDDGSQYYLRHLPDGTYATAGTIFLYGDNSADFTDLSSFIYGHNMMNGTMFGSLKNYVDDKYKDHKFYIYLPDGTRHTYQFFAVATVPQSSQAYTWSFANDDSFKNWQMFLKEMSLVNCTAQVDTTKKYVTLSTCNGSYGTTKRLIITGQEIKVDKVQKPAGWYDEYAASIANKNSQRQKVAEDVQTTLSSIQASKRKELYDERRKK